MKERHFKVLVRCMTFNHASYIEDAMNGFTMQQTTFPFVCVIIDDCSTDGEQEVIKNYLQEHFDLDDKSVDRDEDTDDYTMTFAQHKENKNCFFAVYYLKYNHYSIKKSKMPYIAEWVDNAKYAALCEGDDYWINAMKLQTQVDALEAHSECTIAYCRCQRIRKSGKFIKNSFMPSKGQFKEGIVTLKDFCDEEFDRGYWCFHTSTFVFRCDYLKMTTERKAFFKEFPYGDMPTQLWCLLHGNGYFVNSVGSCYRVLSGGYNSVILKDKHFALSQTKRLQNALLFFDKFTEYEYTKQIRIRLLRNAIHIDELEGRRFSLYKHKNLIIARQKKPLYHLFYILKQFSPNLYNKLKSIHNSL